MSKKLFLLLAISLAAAVYAAPKPKLSDRYNKWLNQEVVYIISDEERKGFLQLASDEQREQFIKDFWDLRNPAPGSETNIYKAEIYERLDYANAHFGRMTNTPGWMTDMGRTWIELGKPESHVAFTGFSQIYPIELWLYENKNVTQSLPPFFYVLFFQPEGIEEYRFYRPSLDGPMKLVRGSQFNSNQDIYKFLMPLAGDLARSAFTLIPGDPIDTRTWKPDLSSDMLINKIENLANDRFNLAKLRQQRAMRTLVTSQMLVAGKPLTVAAVVLTDPLQEMWADYAVAIDDEGMGTRTPDGQFAVDIRYRLLTAKGQLIIEDQDQSKYRAYEQDKEFRPFDVAGRLPVVPGNYRLQVEVVNHSSSKSFKAEEVLKAGALADTWLNGPLLADTVTTVQRPDPITPFQYYGAQFHPLLRGRISTHHTMRILCQVHTAQPGDYQVSYILANLLVREARKVINEPLAAQDFKDGLLLKVKSIPLSDLPAGEYMLGVQLKSATGDVIASTNRQIHLQEGSDEVELSFLANTRALATPTMQSYVRGLGALAQHDDGAALRYMEKSTAQSPGNSFAKQYLVELYYHKRNYVAITDLYRKSAIADFKLSPEVLAQISVSLWRTGDKGEATKVLKQAENFFPKNQLLADTRKSLGKEQP